MLRRRCGRWQGNPSNLGSCLIWSASTRLHRNCSQPLAHRFVSSVHLPLWGGGSALLAVRRRGGTLGAALFAALCSPGLRRAASCHRGIAGLRGCNCGGSPGVGRRRPRRLESCDRHAWAPLGAQCKEAMAGDRLRQVVRRYPSQELRCRVRLPCSRARRKSAARCLVGRCHVAHGKGGGAVCGHLNECIDPPNKRGALHLIVPVSCVNLSFGQCLFDVPWGGARIGLPVPGLPTSCTSIKHESDRRAWPWMRTWFSLDGFRSDHVRCRTA